MYYWCSLTEFSEGGELVVLLSHNSFNFMQETFVPSLFAKYFFSVKPSSRPLKGGPFGMFPLMILLQYKQRDDLGHN